MGLGSNREREMAAKKGTSLYSIFTIQKGVPLEFHSWCARGCGGDREEGNDTQPRVAVIEGRRNISDVGGGRAGRTDFSQNAAHGRSLANVEWKSEGGRKHQQI